MKTRCVLWLLLGWMAFVPTGTWAMTAEKLPPKGPVHVAIKEIISGTLSQGELVVIKGRFLGWKGCRGAKSMITRSDWAIEDDTGCIMVTGPLPDGFHPINSVGRKLTIKGRVYYINKERGRKGTPILRFVKELQ